MQTRVQALCGVLAILWFSLVPVSLAVADDPRDIAKRVSPSVVLLVVEDSGGQPLAMGSGFVVRKGVVATNMHVIEGAARAYAKLAGDKTKYNITGVVATDLQRDLVLLSVDGMNATSLAIGDSHAIAAGDTVYAVGNPRGLEGTFSAGIVSSVRKIGEDSLLQITAPISPGSSGGPVLSSKGEVIGVAVATFKGGQNLNFAIPSEYLSALIPAIKDPVDLPKAAEARKMKAERSILDDLGGRGTEGVQGEAFTWDQHTQDGDFSFSIKNRLREPVRDVSCLVVFYDATQSPIDVTLVRFGGIVPGGLAKRVRGNVDGSVDKLNTPIAAVELWKHSPPRPASGKVEFRVLSFDIVASDEPADARGDANPQPQPPAPPPAEERPDNHEQHGAGLLTDSMTKDEFRSCGLHKLDDGELAILNVWFLKSLVALRGAAGAAGDDVPLYDKAGNPVAYLDPADEMTIYMWSGKPVAYLSGKSIYGFNGRHLGWFSDALVYEPKGKIVAASERSMAARPRPAPARGFKQFKPLKALEQLAPLEPLYGIGWSDTPTDVFLLQGSK